jgi:DNA-binding transcriptional ArsR family regulator
MNTCSSIQLSQWGGDGMTRRITAVDRCDCNVIHEDIVERVQAKMPPEESLYDLAELFKVFGDSTRTRILWALDEAEMCVHDLAYLLNMTQSAVSHQLRVLKQAKLVKNRKEGKIVFYSLEDEHVRQIFELGLIHINE